MNMNRSELLHAEESGAASGWVSPLSQEDREYFAYLRKVFKQKALQQEWRIQPGPVKLGNEHADLQL